MNGTARAQMGKIKTIRAHSTDFSQSLQPFVLKRFLYEHSDLSAHALTRYMQNEKEWRSPLLSSLLAEAR